MKRQLKIINDLKLNKSKQILANEKIIRMKKTTYFGPEVK